MAKRISELLIGSKVVDPDTKYYGKPIVWLIADKNHEGYPTNSITLISEQILCLKCFDAKEPDSLDPEICEYGNSQYSISNINLWLNSTGNWYRTQHELDEPPSKKYVRVGHHSYENENGFLTNFSQYFKNVLITTNLKTITGINASNDTETLNEKIFLASTTEIGGTNEKSIAEGSKLSLFSGNNSRMAYLTLEAFNNSGVKNSEFITIDKPFFWWLRTPHPARSFLVKRIDSAGKVGESEAFNSLGIRPLCNIKNNILVSDDTDSDGAYRIEWNQPPNPPSEITVPEVIKSNKIAKISWGTALDPEGGSIGYELERKVDSNSWTRIYKGINKEFTDNIVKGWGTVVYRVKAYDNHGAESGYTTGPTRTVTNNTDPVINTSTGSELGQKTGPFNLSYSVNDEDAGQTLTVKEYINETQKRSYTVDKGQTYNLQVTKENWQELLNGNHNLKIVVEDSEGGRAEKTFTFFKNETEIELEIKNPLPADDIITKAVINVLATIPNDAIMNVEACNNAFDEEPNWIDVTSSVQKGRKIFFKNKTKTANSWGFNVRVKVNRNGATGDCYITEIGGNFE